MSQPQESTGDEMSQRMRDNVRDWLTTEGWQVNQGQDPQAQWLWAANDNRGRHVSIAQEIGKRDKITVLAALAVAENHQQRFRNLPQDERNSLIFSLQHDLVMLDVGYRGVGEPFERMVFSKASYLDGLTKDLFMGRVERVRNATILVTGMIARALSEPPPSNIPDTPPATP